MLDKSRPRVMILRMGHRIPRDERVTTHVCLTARALGADGIIVSDTHDGRLADTVQKVVEEFGGKFTIETGTPWRSVIGNWKKMGGTVIHLTAYGLLLPDVIEEIKNNRGDKLVVVGAEKMPGELFQQADWNVSVTSQPISEVSALGIFLDWFYNHQLSQEFPGARKKIVPSSHGKNVAEVG